jgi:DNA-directed RNA polymerase specialized sigma24 family protein
MESSQSAKKGWVLTEEAFAKFLSSLDPDRDCAGEKYETLRAMLVKFFEWREAWYPEDFADETLNRVARKIDSGEVVRDITTFCIGVARLVLLESRKGPDSRRADLEDLTLFAAPVPDELDKRQECLNHCLRELPDDNRLLILQYYQENRRKKIDNRAALAERLGIPLNALRSRAQRIRGNLEQCVKRCVKKNNY